VFQFVFGGVRVYGLGELAGSCCVLFLSEQVRDLRVQEFLSELVVSVVTPSDIAGLIIVKILHCGKDGDEEQVTRTSKQFSCVCHCSSPLSSLVFISCMLIYLCLIDILAWVV